MRLLVDVRAIVPRSGLLLVVKKDDDAGAIYSFPGGGVEQRLSPRALVSGPIQIAHGVGPLSPIDVGDIM